MLDGDAAGGALGGAGGGRSSVSWTTRPTTPATCALVKSEALSEATAAAAATAAAGDGVLILKATVTPPAAAGCCCRSARRRSTSATLMLLNGRPVFADRAKATEARFREAWVGPAIRKEPEMKYGPSTNGAATGGGGGGGDPREGAEAVTHGKNDDTQTCRRAGRSTHTLRAVEQNAGRARERGGGALLDSCPTKWDWIPDLQSLRTRRAQCAQRLVAEKAAERAERAAAVAAGALE